ncbi:NADP-dependent oxidoreductase [Nocardia sp. alder85J]|uniref:NADP-dependent oxidoreductase n=1 Tax=Nocardia sp. alder85J TaxID=2862949 RepID=UPI001CD6FE69|nr:NADP-dependent oxidoreductase [Nocardia sp. alder85J]MCX4096416.1 NADP-dependent oxidoreductase [Nocardia sp. alder85J]
MTITTHTVLLAARPEGLPDPATFRLVAHPLPQPGPGEVLIRNLYMSLDPGMLMLIGAYPGIPMPPYQVGAPLSGDAVGEVIASDRPEAPVGALVRHRLGWREHAVAGAGEVQVLAAGAFDSPSGHLSTGLVAYVGLTAVAGMRSGDTVYVSSAAGAVGSAAGQLARLLGAGRVVGSAGSPEKVAHAREKLGYDAVFDYHDGVLPQLRAAAPEGVDVYFDNVGGDHLRAALEVMNPGGRIALCGALARQRAGGAPDSGPGDLLPVIGKRLTLRGFTVGDHLDRAAEYGALLRTWLAEGAIVQHETVIDGLANAPAALLDLIHGRHLGKTVVRLTR